MNKQYIQRKLGGRFFTVVFKKKDGTMRTLNGRLGVTKYIKPKDTTTVTPRPVNDNIITVYDVQAKGYRSFDISRVYTISQGKTTLYGREYTGELKRSSLDPLL